MANQLMLEEKARKAAAEKERIIRRRKKMTRVRFNRHSKIVANQLLSAQQAMHSEEECETLSETGDSPPKITAVAQNFGGAKPNSIFKYIAQQQEYLKDILSQAVSTTKKMPVRNTANDQAKDKNTDSAQTTERSERFAANSSFKLRVH